MAEELKGLHWHCQGCDAVVPASLAMRDASKLVDAKCSCGRSYAEGLLPRMHGSDVTHRRYEVRDTAVIRVV
jgi:hypothetical protein